MNTVTLLGIDIGKNTFHLHGQDARGNQLLRKKLNRSQLLPYLTQLPTCKIAMESCGGSQWLARQIESLGHRVQLIAAQHVKAYVTGNKNDFIDAEAICEAASRPRTHSVPVKTLEQQILSTEHKLRKSWVDNRTGIINQVHGFLLEFGIIFPVGYAALEQVPALMENHELPIRLRNAVERMLLDIQRLTRDIKTIDVEIKQQLSEDAAGMRLLSIPGIGPLTASALLADVGDASTYKSSRDFAASLGLVPRQYSTGWQDELARHQQTRRQVSALPTGARRSRTDDPNRQAKRCARSLGKKAFGSQAAEQGRLCASQQNGKNRLGCVSPRR